MLNYWYKPNHHYERHRMFATIALDPDCRLCGSTDLTAGGYDGNDEPITTCADCGARQEEE